MIESLSLRNFKAWRSIDVMRLAPLTGLFGANSSGKSSILQFLLLLKQTAESTDRAEVLHFGSDRDYVSLGSLNEVLHGHDADSPLVFGLFWQLSQELRIPDPAEQDQTLFASNLLGYYAAIAGSASGAPFVHKFGYRFAGRCFEMSRVDGTDSRYEIGVEPKTFEFKRSVGRPRHGLPPPVKCYGFPDEVRAAYQNAEFLVDFELQLRQLLARTFYLGPLREHPQRQYVWAGSQPEDVGRHGERAVFALLSGRERGLKVRPGPRRKAVPLEAYVAARLRDLGVVHGFEVQAEKPGSDVYRVWVKVRPSSPPALLTDVGFGVSQVLPVAVLCYYAPEGSVLLLEQPEIHLHPAVQAALADLLIDAVKSRGVQIILESHSEHLLMRLQRRIAEEHRRTPADTPFTADQAALYFARTVGSRSELVPLKLSPYGDITNWPDDFFGDRFGEARATTEAQIRRRRGRGGS